MFDWNKFIDTAKTLNSIGDESSCRSAVSRAYYAAYHSVCGKIGYPPPGVSSKHQETLRETMKKDLTTASKLTALLEKRKDADYESSKSGEFNPSNAKLAIQEAESIISSVPFL